MDVEELYKKGLDNHDGVITHLEPDILECQVEALLQTKLVEKVVHTQSYPTLWDPVDCSLPGSSVHGILQAEILEWVTISFSTGSSWPRDQTWVSCIAGRFFTIWAIREALTMWITTNWKLMGIPDHLTCLLRNLYAGQEATVRTRHGIMDWFKMGKGVTLGCILSLCLFNLYAGYIMQNVGLDESQAGIKIARRHSNNSNMQIIPP